MAQHNILGERGEEIAKSYLINKGYIVYGTNWRFGKFEIDLIADDGEEIVFVEVKTRSNLNFGTPEEAVGPEKEAALLHAADVYLKNIDTPVSVRFDIIAIEIQDKQVNLRHIIDAFSTINNANEELSQHF